MQRTGFCGVNVHEFCTNVLKVRHFLLAVGVDAYSFHKSFAICIATLCQGEARDHLYCAIVCPATLLDGSEGAIECYGLVAVFEDHSSNNVLEL